MLNHSVKNYIVRFQRRRNDYDAVAARSEALRFEFPTEICSAVLDLNLLTIDDGNVESGRWTALDSQGELVASGQSETRLDTGLLNAQQQIEVKLPAPAVALKIEASAYANDAAISAGENNSDFAVRGIRWTRPSS